MTSPSQLKYLQAMGIPVWVSRDLVLDAEQPDSNSDIQGESLDKNTSPDVVNKIIEELETKVVVKPQLDKTKNETTANEIQNSPNQVPATDSLINVIGQTQQHVVFASGNLQADWIVIGESPEFIHDMSDQPYSGDQGILLENMLRAVGIDNPRRDAYLVNVLSISQQKNNDQTVSSDLNQLLLNTIKQVKPKMLLLVGQLAAQNLLQSKEPIARLRGKAQKLANTEIPIIVTYYPSYLLSKPLDKRKAWDDLKLAMSLLD